MTRNRLLLILVLPSATVLLGCPTRPIVDDGGAGGTSTMDGNVGRGGGAGTTGGFGGARAGAGGTSNQDGGAASGGAAGAIGGQGGAGSGGKAATGGIGGGAVCSNTDSDASNCGSCGHSCLGGQCASGICQPLLLGSVPSTTEYAHETVVLDGTVYVFTGDGQDEPSNIWRTDATTPGTPMEVATNGTVSCVMNGQLFWITDVQGTFGIASCVISNCPATTTPIVTLSSGKYFPVPPACDVANNEIVWTSTPDNAAFTISRASSNGLNERTVTSIQFPDSYWQFNNNGFLSGRADRIFYHHFDLTADTDVLYYVSTNAVNAAGVQIAALQNIGLGLPIAAPPDLANDTIFLGNEYSSSTSDYLVLGIPLPNGVLSGTPPTFMDGYVCSGVVDEANFYGTICDNAMVPQDAVVECPLSNCSAPTIIARGQASAINFADDATAIYWTTSGQGSNVAIWKAAK